MGGICMSEFTDYLVELFEQFGAVSVRKMFGGYGIYRDGIMFGLVADDNVYLKADAASAEHFKSRGLAPFEYEKNGKTVKLSYFLAPDEIMDDPTEAAIWAQRAFDVAFRAKRHADTKKTRRNQAV